MAPWALGIEDAPCAIQRVALSLQMLPKPHSSFGWCLAEIYHLNAIEMYLNGIASTATCLLVDWSRADSFFPVLQKYLLHVASCGQLLLGINSAFSLSSLSQGLKAGKKSQVGTLSFSQRSVTNGSTAQPRLNYCTQLCLRLTVCDSSKQELPECREGREPAPAWGGKDSSRQRAFGAEAVSKV